jgi:hypothetical protein
VVAGLAETVDRAVVERVQEVLAAQVTLHQQVLVRETMEALAMLVQITDQAVAVAQAQLVQMELQTEGMVEMAQHHLFPVLL